MPSETLRIPYTSTVRANRYRVKHPVLRGIARVLLVLLGLSILIAVLMKLGVIQDPERGGGHAILA